MGTKMGPNYANLFVGYVEERIFDQFDGPVPELFGRYIDDCFGATSCGRPELDRFIQFVNTFHPALEFTWEISTSSVTFLDINVSIQNDGLATSVHYKPTDSHSYLLHSSSHPPHVKKSIPNNLRVKDIILKNFKLLQSDPDTATIFEKPPLVSFKRDKSLRNSLVKGSLST